MHGAVQVRFETLEAVGIKDRSKRMKNEQADEQIDEKSRWTNN